MLVLFIVSTTICVLGSIGLVSLLRSDEAVRLNGYFAGGALLLMAFVSLATGGALVQVLLGRR